MHGDYDEPDASELGRTPFDWQIAAVGVLAVGLFVFSFFAGGRCAQGAEPPPQAPPVQAPPVVRSAPVPKSAPSPPRLIGWNYTQPDGSVLFVPVQQPTPPGAIRYPAPGVAAPSRPFAEGIGSRGGGPTTTDAPTAAPFNPGWSPAGRTFPVIPTVARPVGRGVRTSDCPT